MLRIVEADKAETCSYFMEILPHLKRFTAHNLLAWAHPVNTELKRDQRA